MAQGKVSRQMTHRKPIISRELTMNTDTEEENSAEHTRKDKPIGRVPVDRIVKAIGCLVKPRVIDPKIICPHIVAESHGQKQRHSAEYGKKAPIKAALFARQ